MINTEKFESIVDYTTILDGFEGPIDLLLYLVRREEIEIRDIFVSKVTEQFLEYMQGLEFIDVEKVGEYLRIATQIIRIKSQTLLPVVGDDMEAYEELEAEKEDFFRMLEDHYRMIKEESVKLKERETFGYYFKEPDKDVGETKTVFTLEGLTLDGLIGAFSKLMLKRRLEEKLEETKEIPQDSFTVQEKLTFILESLEEGKERPFEQLFSQDFTKVEIITTFQALLELLKYQYLLVRQETEFGEILISLNPDRKKEADFGQVDVYD